MVAAAAAVMGDTDRFNVLQLVATSVEQQWQQQQSQQLLPQ
jgi:hypothetical protein